ncbi:MAG: hypothetical protein ACX931_05525 [Saccharospirillum sp.]
MLSEIKDIAVGLSAVFTAFFAFKGISTWRAELKGRSEYQIAKDTLRAVYRVREAFKHVRGPAIYGYEYPEEMTNTQGHLKNEFKHAGTAHVYEKRWKVLHEAFVDLEKCHLEAMVEWGSEYQDVIVPLRKCRVDVQLAIQHLLSRYQNPHEPDWMNVDEQKEQQAILYYGGENSKYNTFTPKIDDAVTKFEVWLRPHVSRKRS